MGDDFTNSRSLSASIYLADKYNEYSIQIIRWILKAISLWPLPVDASFVEKIRFDFAVFICYFLIIAVMIPSGLSIFVESQESFETRFRSFGPLTFWFFGLLNYSCLLIHIDDIRICVDHVKTDWRNMTKVEDQKLMLRSAKKGRFFGAFCAIFMHSGVFSYNVSRSFGKDILHVGNSSIEVRALPYPFYSKILNAHYSPAYEFVFLIQCLSSFVVNSVTVATAGLAAALIFHACGQLKILMSRLDNLVDETDEKNTSLKQRYGIIVRHHLRALSLVTRVEKIMNFICLVELFGCTFHICIVGYYCMMDYIHGNNSNVVSYSMIITSVTLNIFVFCLIGEMLSEQGGQIAKSAYMTKWYLLTGNNANGLVLIILRSNVTVKITAGKVAQLSIATFGDVN
ncbi:uncharacterized protein LOC105432448 [Pogonomyrmex barbatus]|uniref:Odorant receptor n=1 Tax=Pogonomyrmex barbatus TaxID=144034 RepID=A0A8N1SAN8_9HYME|nr:uncharacterized protein LOC105432448 [Pogonomyrmex barbatus]